MYNNVKKEEPISLKKFHLDKTYIRLLICIAKL